MDLDLSGKSALVTGASQGIGKACARELALLGCRVVIVARNEEKLAEAVEEFEALSPQGHSYVVADLSDRKMIQKFKNSFDILINNMGGTPGGLIMDAKEEDFEKAFHNHLFVSAALAQVSLPEMKRKGYGRIINILSSSVKAPIPFLGVSNTVRWAVAAWAKTLAGEVGPFGITVNSILPGAIDTERLKETVELKAHQRKMSPQEIIEERLKSIPARRIGDPKEIGAVVAFLASPAASYVNGTAIAVDGGHAPGL